MNVMELQNISKSYGKGVHKKTVLKDINLTIGVGEFIWLKGKSASGKTTLINLILGLQQADSGTVKLFNEDPQDPQSKIHVGAMLQNTPSDPHKFPDDITVKEAIALFRSYYPESQHIEEILEQSSLDKDINGKNRTNEEANKLNGGSAQFFRFLLALIGNPDFILLDEPTTSLDASDLSLFWKEVQKFSDDGKTILFISHSKTDQEKLSTLASRVVELKEGRIAENKLLRTLTAVHAGEDRVANPFNILLGQIQAEVMGAWRDWRTCLSLLIFTLIPLLAQFIGSPIPVNTPLLLAIGSMSLLLTFSMQQLGVKLAAQRSSGWTSFLKITPLPAWIYLAAKVITFLIVATLSLILMFCIEMSKTGEPMSLNLLFLFAALVLGSIPFTFLGFAMGNLFASEHIPLIALLVLLGGSLSCGLTIPGIPEYVQNLMPLSPFYNYAQVTAWVGNFDLLYNGHGSLSLQWLLWYAITFGYLAIWSYRRSFVKR
jgi:ABC-2 type transport system ATP-binding protein